MSLVCLLERPVLSTTSVVTFSNRRAPRRFHEHTFLRTRPTPTMMTGCARPRRTDRR